jgi:hypothetical protein
VSSKGSAWADQTTTGFFGGKAVDRRPPSRAFKDLSDWNRRMNLSETRDWIAEHVADIHRTTASAACS